MCVLRIMPRGLLLHVYKWTLLAMYVHLIVVANQDRLIVRLINYRNGVESHLETRLYVVICIIDYE